MPGHRESIHTHTRLHSNSGGYYLQSPPSTQPYSDPRLQDTSGYYSSLPLTSMSQSPYSQPTHQHDTIYPTSGPSQPLYTMAPQVQAPLSAPQIRSSTGAWTATDDQTLMQARQAGMAWMPIKQMYFPSKTPNACRKRHERLMEKRNVDDWDTLKLQNVAKKYMAMRKEIWAGLAEATGEKWMTVEQRCMSTGFKNLQQASRSSHRRERLQIIPDGHLHIPIPIPVSSSSSSHLSAYQNVAHPYSSSSSSSYPDHHDDHEHFDELEDYNDGSSDRSSGYGVARETYEYAGGDVGRGDGMGSGSVRGDMGRGSGRGDGMRGDGMRGGGSGRVGGSGSGRGERVERVGSLDMGIDSIINRPR